MLNFLCVVGKVLGTHAGNDLVKGRLRAWAATADDGADLGVIDVTGSLG